MDGDECSIPHNFKTPFFKDLQNSFKEVNYSNIFDCYIETYQNISGLFKKSEIEVREEINYYLKSTEEGISCIDKYRINHKKNPFDGMFKRE